MDRGTGGADLIDGGAGDDTLTGGAGFDRFVHSGGHDVITDLDAGLEPVVLEGFVLADLPAITRTQSQEGLVLTHAGGSLTFTGLTLDDLAQIVFVVEGLEIAGLALADTMCRGTQGADNLTIGTADTRFDALDGNDSIFGGAHDDLVFLGDGDDEPRQ